MPPKPAEMQLGSGKAFYNIDFSLNHQLRLAGAAPSTPLGDKGMGDGGGGIGRCEWGGYEISIWGIYVESVNLFTESMFFYYDV